MPCSGRDGRVLLEDLADSLERSRRRSADRIGDGVVRSRPSALGPHEVVLAVLRQHEGTFDVAGGGDLLEGRAVGERDEAGEGVVEASDVTVPPAAVDYIEGAACRVAEDHLVDGLRAVVKAVDERVAEQVDEGARGRARASDADAADGAVVAAARTFGPRRSLASL